MKYKICLLSLSLSLIITGCDKNSNKSTQSISQESKELCYSTEETAKQIMYARQSGASMGELLKRLDKLEKQQGSDTSQIVDLMASLIRDAYKVPLTTSEEGKKNAIDEFQNEALIACLDAFSKK